MAVFSALNVLAGYELDTANRILVVTLGSGEEQTFDAQYEDCLANNQVTNVIKRGNGTLVMGTTNRSAYTGDFTVEAGTLSYAGNNALGSLASGSLKIFVKNGATLRRKGGSLIGKTVYFEGEGVDGIGALCADSYGDNPWGKSVAMTADALITCNGACSFTYGTTFEMAGHTLRIRQRSNPDSDVGFKGVNFYRLGTSEASPGTIVVEQGKCYVADGRNWPSAGGLGTLVLTNSTSFKISGLYPAANLDWSWVWASTNSVFDLHQNSAGRDKGIEPYQIWKGPFEIRGVPRLMIKTLANTPRNADISFVGKVSGGGFYLEGTGDMTADAGGNPHLHLMNGANDFTNGVSATLASVHLWTNGALPSVGGDLVLTNSAVHFDAAAGAYALPGLTVCGTGYVGNASGIWNGGVVKRGNGGLDYASFVGMSSLTVEGGSVKLPTSGTISNNPLAGLIGGVTYGKYSACPDTSILATNAIELSSAAFYDRQHEYWSRQMYDPSGVATDMRIVTYSGYLWNRADHDVIWTFAGCCVMHYAFFLNGTQVVYQTEGNGKTCCRTNAVLHPGANPIQIRVYATDGGGPVQSNAGMVWDAKGFPWYIPNAEGSGNQDDYLKLEDPGDGSLLTWALPGEVPPDTIPGTEDPLKVIGDIPVIALAAGTSVDMGGNVGLTDQLSGCGSLTNSPLLVVSERWTLGVSDIAAGSKLTSDGKIVFADGAKIAIDGDRCAEGTYTVAEAAGGIEGDPEIETQETKGKWIKSIQDGRIDLTFRPNGLVIIVL